MDHGFEGLHRRGRRQSLGALTPEQVPSLLVASPKMEARGYATMAKIFHFRSTERNYDDETLLSFLGGPTQNSLTEVI